MSVYYRDDGKPSRFPTTKEHAASVKSFFYDDGVKCTICNEMSVKYTHGDECRFCTRHNAVHFYNLSVGSELVYIDESTGKAMAKIAMRPSVEIDPIEYEKMCKLLELSKDDQAFRVSTEPCKIKAHYGLKHGGKCYECSQDKLKPTPRKAAMMDGQTWYTPMTPCLHCHTLSDRNVHNGQCKGCVKMPDKRETPDSIMMRENSDMIVSREDARQFEMKVYRTGEACKRGHNNWRYVSTGNCITCLRS